MTESNYVCVQILPVIKSESTNQILLCKWIVGNYMDRYTGFIRAVDFKECADNSNFREKLEQTAASLLPYMLTPYMLNVELVAILNFADPPAYDEYVYIVCLSENASTIADVEFDGNPADWFHWEDIPFDEMPQDDHLWYPKVLEDGLKVTGSFTFGSIDEKTLKSYHIDTVSQL